MNRNDQLRPCLPTIIAADNAQSRTRNKEVDAILRQSTIMTDRGPAVLLPPSPSPSPSRSSRLSKPTAIRQLATSAENDDEETSGRGRRVEEERSPIAQMLYSRWLNSLRESRKLLWNQSLLSLAHSYHRHLTCASPIHSGIIMMIIPLEKSRSLYSPSWHGFGCTLFHLGSYVGNQPRTILFCCCQYFSAYWQSWWRGCLVP